MLVTKFEWHLNVLEDETGAQVASWKAVVATFDTTPFLLHYAGGAQEEAPTVVFVPTIGILMKELERLPSLDRVKVDAILPMRGCQAVRELWVYECEDDAAHYAYVSREGSLEPCISAQHRPMANLKRKFVLGRQRNGGSRIPVECAAVSSGASCLRLA
ncbi:hypothetical protein [Cupriavidus metallidurans]|uniref:hypothetical protein n=1 Tax=Cupriavidus metallidurans TaxID=119219 RepID=UPI000559C113|nr:hypothetical protein [Cupriavidus metallidurans]